MSYDLVGPIVYTMKEIVEFDARKADTKYIIILMSTFVGYLQALACSYFDYRVIVSPPCSWLVFYQVIHRMRLLN